LILLAALRDGIVLFDDGAWARHQARFRELLANGTLIPLDRGWRVARKRPHSGATAR